MSKQLLSVLVKPVSGLCNLRCAYCFYQEHAVGAEQVLSDETAEALVREMFRFGPERCAFLFQGGEPTLAGLGFYERFVRLVERYNTGGLPVDFALQTNGQAINMAWAEFFQEKGFLVGVSIDGTKEVHDMNRHAPNGAGSFDQAQKAVDLLRAADVPYSILVTVTDALAGKAEEIFLNCVKNGWGSVHVIPVLPNSPAERALSPGVYGAFLCALFDRWYEALSQGQYVSIRLFDNYVRMLSGSGYELCGLTGRCAPSVVVERDGSCYPCDFYVAPERALGNIRSDTLDTIRARMKETFLVGAGPAQTQRCLSCAYKRICGGGCRRYRDEKGAYVLCESNTAFFEHCLLRLLQLAECERKLRSGWSPSGNTTVS